MKIRKGFVSNSSSASFIVEVSLSQDKIIPFLTTNLDSTFSLCSVLGKLEEKKEHFEKAKSETFTWEKILTEIEELTTSLVKTYEEYLREEDPQEKEKLGLEYLKAACSSQGVYLFENKESFKLYSVTAMFYSSEDAPQLLKEVISACNFQKIPLTCKIEEIR